MERERLTRWAALAALVLAAPTAPAWAVTRVAAPQPAARAAILVEEDVGSVVAGRNSHERLAIASTTKLMTALVTLEREPLGRIVTVAPYSPGPQEVTAGLRAGSPVAIRDLLRAMLLPSANDAAYTLALRVGGSVGNFVAEMNAQARALGLADTHYATPIGLDVPGNYSSAADLARLAEALLRRYPFFAKTVAEPRAVLPSAGDRVVVNRNSLVGRYSFVVGVKTGHTNDAGYCLVAAASHRGVHLVSVVLGDSSEGAASDDTLALLRYGLDNYHRAVLVHRDRVYADVAVAGMPALRVGLIASRTAERVLRRGTKVEIYLNAVPPEVVGPLAAGTQIGEIEARSHAGLLADVPLVTAQEVPAPTGARLLAAAPWWPPGFD